MYTVWVYTRCVLRDWNECTGWHCNSTQQQLLMSMWVWFSGLSCSLFCVRIIFDFSSSTFQVICTRSVSHNHNVVDFMLLIRGCFSYDSFSSFPRFLLFLLFFACTRDSNTDAIMSQRKKSEKSNNRFNSFSYVKMRHVLHKSKFIDSYEKLSIHS